MANYKNEFASNNVDLQSILDTVNNLPVQENIDAEISTQDDLITQIYTALEGKTAGGGAKAICFSIAGTYYPAEEGMTWEEWVNSDYNTGGYFLENGCVADETLMFICKTTFPESATSEIASNYNYKLYPM